MTDEQRAVMAQLWNNPQVEVWCLTNGVKYNSSHKKWLEVANQDLGDGVKYGQIVPSYLLTLDGMLLYWPGESAVLLLDPERVKMGIPSDLHIETPNEGKAYPKEVN